MAPYWECLRWMAFMGASAAIWKYLALPVYRAIAVLSRNEDRRRYALEVLRLARPDASAIPSYLANLGAEQGRPLTPGEKRASTEKPSSAGASRVVANKRQGLTSNLPRSNYSTSATDGPARPRRRRKARMSQMSE
jgi:hypothetical protein